MTEKPKRTKKPPIDFARLTERQAIQVQRIALAGASIGVAQKEVQQASLMAVHDTFDTMIEALDDEDLVGVIFSKLAYAATPANAKRIVQHRLCPPHVAAEVAERLDAAQRAAEARKKPAPAPKPGASAPQQQ